MDRGGTAGKKDRRAHAKRLTEDGIPRDGREWTLEDWKSLHEAMKKAKAEIAERHKEGGA